MFPEVDPLLGPEMRSTGEVLGMADSFGLAFFKAQEAAGSRLPLEGTVLITVAERDRELVLAAAQEFHALGFKIRATAGTHAFLAEHGIASEPILKLHEGRPNIEDAIKNGEIQLVVNTPAGQVERVRRLLHPQGGHPAQGALHHHDDRRPGGGRRASPPAATPADACARSRATIARCGLVRRGLRRRMGNGKRCDLRRFCNGGQRSRETERS